MQIGHKSVERNARFATAFDGDVFKGGDRLLIVNDLLDSVLYPLYASTFIWGAVVALLAYGTPIRPVNVAGMALIVGGMFLMGK